MRIEIQNFRCIEEMSFDVDKITLIGGPNGSGKTTVLQATGIAASRPIKPLGLNKKDLNLLVRHGCAKGKTSLSTSEGEATFTLPGGELVTNGKPIELPPIIAGMESFSDLSLNDRLANLTEILEAFPTKKDLEEEIADEIDRDVISKVWAVIEEDGWDYAHRTAKEKGTKLKGSWEYVTNERYGSRKAESWEPPEVDNNMTLEQIDKKLENIKGQESLLFQLESAGVTLSNIDEIIDEKRKAFEEVSDEKTAALVKLREIPDFNGNVGIPCPWCKKSVRTERKDSVVKLVKAKGTASDKEIKEAKDETKKLQDEIDMLEKKITEEKLNPQPLIELKKQIDKHEIKFNSVEEVREEAKRLEENKRAIAASTEAGRIAKQIIMNKLIVDALAPSGVRKKVLVKAVDRFNAVLNRVTEIANWRGVEVDYDMGIYYDSNPIAVFDRYSSIRWRINVAMQVALASLSKSPLVLIDAADILDKSGRNGLFKVMAHKMNEIAFVVTMTADNADDLPNLADKGIGRTLWLTG